MCGVRRWRGLIFGSVAQAGRCALRHRHLHAATALAVDGLRALHGAHSTISHDGGWKLDVGDASGREDIHWRVSSVLCVLVLLAHYKLSEHTRSYTGDIRPTFTRRIVPGKQANLSDNDYAAVSLAL